MSTDAFPKLKSSAPGQYLGYGLQPLRLCYHLLTSARGFKVSLELCDDVAIHCPDGSLILEQSKSALSGNPAADRSTELWKTLANWAEQPSSNLDAATTFRYYVTPVKTGKLVALLHGAKVTEDIDPLLKKFKTPAFQGEAGVGIHSLILRFLASGDDVCRKIIRGFEFVSEADPSDAIRERLSTFISDATIDHFCSAAIGIAKDAADKLIRGGKSAILDSETYKKDLRAFILKYDFSNLLNPTVDAPADQQIAELVKSHPTFVRQLAAVDASESMIRTAVSDYLRAISDKVNWADAGNVVESSLDELDTSLVRHHGMTQDEINDMHSALDVHAKGRQLYRRCVELKTPLEGRFLPDYFIAGEYNYLADECRLGWHPDHVSLFPAGAS